MQDERHTHRRIGERDAARARLRRVTGVVLTASVAVAGALAGYVSSASGHKSAGRGVATGSATATETKTTTTVPVPATPAAPSLVPSGSSSQSSQAQPSVQAPATSAAPPVVVSGGS